MVILDKIKEADGTETHVMIDTLARWLSIELILVNGHRVDQSRGFYPTIQHLSADLRDTLGYGPALDLLVRNRVPRESRLWDLNHSNPWENPEFVAKMEAQEASTTL